MLTNPYGLLLAGIICAAIGGELFVRGVVGIARWARVSAGIIGATFAAFATSSPELSVSVTSALAGTPQIALGDAIGSNVVNLALILGLALLVSPISAPRDSLRRDFPVALLVPLLLGMLAFDGTLSRIDGIMMFGLFLTWLGAVIIEVRRQRSTAGQMLGEPRHGLALLSCFGGMVFLVASGNLIVLGAQGIALAYGIGTFVIGATLVALGTSAPELATALIAKLRGHDEVGLGTLLGSNIFNGLFIISTAAVIRPITITLPEVAIGLLFGLLATAIILPGRNGILGRWRGWALLACYASYLGLILQGSGL
jgi:cation:H+ antiporter